MPTLTETLEKMIRSILMLIAKNREMPIELAKNSMFGKFFDYLPSIANTKNANEVRVECIIMALIQAINSVPSEGTGDDLDELFRDNIRVIRSRLNARDDAAWKCSKCGKMLDVLAEASICNACKNSAMNEMMKKTTTDKMIELAVKYRYDLMNLVKDHKERNKLGKIDDPRSFGKQDLIDAIIVEFINLILESRGIDTTVTIDDLDKKE